MKKLSLILAVIFVFSSFCACAGTGEGENGVEVSTDAPADAVKDPNGKSESTTSSDSVEAPVEGSDSAVPSDSVNDSGAGSESVAPSDSVKDPNGKSESVAPSDSVKDPNAKKETTAPTFTDGMILEFYLGNLAAFFHEDLDDGESLEDYDLFHLTAQFLYTQRTDCITVNGESFSVKAAVLEKNMKLLFGNDIKLSDYKKFSDKALGDSYDKEKDEYVFASSIAAYTPKGYYLSYEDEMDISETKNNVVATVKVCNAKGKKQTVTYVFVKVIEESYLYMQLDKVER